MSERFALLSDIHGNSPALQAVLEDIRRADCAEVYMLGDIINGIDAHHCIQILRSWGTANRVKISCIKGNAEAYLTTPDRVALPRLGEESNQQLMVLIQWFEDHLTEADLTWVRTFPTTIRWRETYLVHDSPIDRLTVQTQSDPEVRPEHREWFFHGPGITPDMTDLAWHRLLAFMDRESIFQVYTGHTHIPFYREFGDKVVCNIGSAGAPLDGDPRPSWVLLDTNSAGRLHPTIRRVRYDVSLIHRLIDDTPDYPNFQIIPGYREAYKMWFSTGIHWRDHLRKTA
jgi:predicted phosphodiesterase